MICGAAGTIEEKIMGLQKQRRDADAAVNSAGANPVRKGREELNVADIRALFESGVAVSASSSRHEQRLNESIDLSESVAASDSSRESGAAAAYGDSTGSSSSEERGFWAGLVTYNRRTVPRHDAAQAITTLYSFELRSNGESIHELPTTTLFGKTLTRETASRLLRLNAAQVEPRSLTERIASYTAMLRVR